MKPKKSLAVTKSGLNSRVASRPWSVERRSTLASFPQTRFCKILLECITDRNGQRPVDEVVVGEAAAVVDEAGAAVDEADVVGGRFEER
jgi:hypothetical protein